MKYRAVFSDLDGTLLNGEGLVPTENQRAIEYLYEIGVPFIPATGRAVESLPAEIRYNPFIRYAITSNGVEIFDLKENKTVSKLFMPKGVAEGFFDCCSEIGNPAVEVYFGGRAYVSKEYYENPAKFNNPRVEYIKNTRTAVEDLPAFAREHDGMLDGLTIIAPKGKMEELAATIRKRFPELYVTTADGIYVEASNPECGKHKGLKRVCAMLGIDEGQAVAFGDNDNDVEMLQAAGFGVAVSNSTEKLKKAADIITASNEEAGVAKTINELFRL